MIYGVAVFDPTVKSRPPSIHVASITPITDPDELQELAVLLAAMSETPETLASRSPPNFPDHQISEER